MNKEAPRPAMRQKESSQWFDILAFPQTLDGFRLNLVNNGPRHIAPRHQRRFRQQVEQTLREKTGQPGFHNPVKINLRPLPLDPQHPDVLSYTATPTQYVEFYKLSGMKRVPRALQEEVRSSGIQVVWRTTEPDGSHKFVFEVRSKNTGLYPSFGGTIGGGIDGTIGLGGVRENPNLLGILDNTGTLEDAGPRKIISHAVLETEEELGIGHAMGNKLRADYDAQNGNIVVMGIGKDKKRNYYDVLCRGLLPYDAATLQLLYDIHKAGGNDKMHDPMPKELVFVDDTPNMYQKLLSSLVPLTPMTQASLLLAGYMSRMEEVFKATGSQEEALREAVAWKKETERLMREKDKKMDERARKERRKLTNEEWKQVGFALLHRVTRRSNDSFYELKDALDQAWNGARLCPKGLSTALPPEKQGLPKIEDTLKTFQEN